jgi:hypothetical protein
MGWRQRSFTRKSPLLFSSESKGEGVNYLIGTLLKVALQSGCHQTLRA